MRSFCQVLCALQAWLLRIKTARHSPSLRVGAANRVQWVSVNSNKDKQDSRLRQELSPQTLPMRLVYRMPGAAGNEGSTAEVTRV